MEIATAPPVVGSDLQSVQELGEVLQDLTVNAASGPLPTANISKVEDLLSKVRGQGPDAGGKVDKAAAIASVPPQTVGADGRTRTYLVAGQSNCEIRSTGGFPGSCGNITASNGEIKMEELGSIVSDQTDAEVTITDDEYSFFGGNIARVASTSTFDPDFPYTALTGDANHIDGVISCGPVFLQQLLALTGGLTTSDGTELDGSNFAKAVMCDVCSRYADRDAQDAFFADATSKAFAQILNNIGPADISKPKDTNKVDIQDPWIVDEETVLGSLRDFDATGFISKDGTGTSELVIYLNETSWCKLDWHLDTSATIGSSTENDDGSTTYHVT